MFIPINNTDMNIFDVDEWINRTRDENGGVISPEFAIEVLSKTNFYGHIKKVLKNIKDKNKTKEEILQYKEFILSCVDGREVSAAALADLSELAEECGCKDEFDKAQESTKYYDVKACEKNVVVSSNEELQALSGTDLDVLFYQKNEDGHENDTYMILDADFACAKKLRFNKFANIHIQRGENFPKEIDFSNCYTVLVNYADFNGDENIKWPGSCDLYTVRKIPANTDLSHCRKVRLEHCDFCKDGELKVGGICDLDFVSFPKKVDLSKCDGIYSEFINGLNGVEEIKFRNKAQRKELISKLGEFKNKVVYEEEEKKISFGDRLKKIWEREVG